MSNAITGLIDGTQTAEQAFSQMFKNIGKAFIDMATQMIAKALVMKVLGILGGGSSGSSIVSGFDVPVSSMPAGMSFAGGGFTGNGPRAGGVDGQGGFPAILHPNETVIDHTRGGGMAEAMARYQAGRGEDGGVVNPQIQVTTGPTLQFEGSQYVSRADFEAGMSQAAKQGAEMGRAMTFNTLRNAPSTRRKLGI
jgi:hypothetical protein